MIIVPYQVFYLQWSPYDYSEINTNLVLDILLDYMDTSTRLKCASVNKSVAAHSKSLFENFLEVLTNLSYRLAESSAQKAKVVIQSGLRNGYWPPPLSYADREYNHQHNFLQSGRKGVGTSIPYTRDQTFDKVPLETLRKIALSQTRVTAPYGWWRSDHALCEPMFYYGPINHFKRMAISNLVLYDAVMHGLSPKSYKGKGQRFFVRRILEERIQ